MLRTISAAPLSVEQAGPSVTRSGPSRLDRNSKSDNDNDFSHALRGAHDNKSDTDSDRDKSTPSTSSNTSAHRQDRKDEAPKKRNVKDDNTNEQSAKAAVPVPTQVQPKDSPLAALLSFVSYRGPAPTEDPKPQPNATGTAVDTSTASPMPVATLPAIVDDAAFPIELKAADVKTGDVKAAAATNGRAQDHIQSMTVPLDSYPILQTGIGWGSAAAAVATSTGTANAASPAAAGAVTADSKTDPLVINAPPASEAVEPSLSPKNTAFAIRLTTDTQQTAKSSEASEAAPAQRFALNSPSIAALEQGTKEDGKSQSNDSSSGQNNPFGAAYTESAAPSRFTSDKPSFAESTSTATTAVTDETAPKPVTSDPLRNILLQLKSDDNRRIDVRLVERSGELHVAVKSADPVLAERLQQNMPELTSRLESEHFTHEVWMPKLSEAQRSESGSNSNDNSAGTDGRSGQQFNGEAGRRQGGQSQSRPDWVDLLENQIG